MDTTEKNNTECYEKYEQLTSYTNITKEKFEKEYKKLFDKETKRKRFYLLLLNELEKAMSDGDLNSLKKFDNFIGYINDIETTTTLKYFYDSGENPMENSNLIILACQYNKVEILKYILSNSGIRNRLSLDIGKSAIEFKDQDEERHNAFYYSIRSNNVELLDTLIKKWPGDYFATYPEQLDEVLSSAYEELKLKNVSLSDEIQIYIENKLINLRFFSDNVKKNKNKNKALNNNFDNVKKRIELVLQNINLLTTEYPNTKKVDDKFLFVIKFIAQNIHILKRQLKSTYNKIPWEEMEFCLVSFVSSHVKQQELNLFYRAVLNKSKILDYLKNFAEVLGNVKEPEMFTHLPKGERPEIVAKIIDNYPQFEELYNDYQQIRDICSLQKMKDYVQLGSLIDPAEKHARLIIIRILQVIGEHLKNSLESPKLSDFMNEVLLLSLSKNTRKVVINLRDLLSHAHSLKKRTEIEKNMTVKFLIGVQNDIKKIGDDINNILHKEKMKVIKTLCKRIENSECLDEIKEVAETFVNTGNEFDIIEEEFQTMECNELQILIKELNNSTIEKTENEQKLLDRVQYVINLLKNKWVNMKREYLTRFKMLRENIRSISETKSNNTTIIITKRFAKKLKNIIPTETCDLEEIVELLLSIMCSFSFRLVVDDFDKVCCIILKMYDIIKYEISNIKWIEDLRPKLTEKASVIPVYTEKEDWNIRKEKYDNDLQLKLAELKDVLTDNKLMGNSVQNLFFYKTSKKLQSVIEMLVLDIMSILGEEYLEKNLFFLDDNSPSLTGKCLRNHLAHDNTVNNILLSDPMLNIILNAKKLVSENIMESKKKIGKSMEDGYLKMRNKYNQSLITIVNQQEMFAALELGRFDDLKSCLRKGADIYARNTSLWTALHFAAKGPNLEIVKFLLRLDLNINVKNVDGQNPLHIAAANGRTNIVKYFVDERGFDVNDTDSYEKTPLHLAAQGNHKDTVKVLLKNGSELDMHDIDWYTPLHHAVRNKCIDIVKILMVQSAHFNINERTIGGFTVLHTAAEFGYLELVNLFLQNKANVSVRNEYNVTPLHIAAIYGHLEVVNALISAGAIVNARDIRGYTPLHNAIIQGHEAIEKVLLTYGADINACDKIYNYTPLHYAVIYGYEEIVLDLLKQKANINVTTIIGITPLHFAAYHGHLEVVNILIDHGANVHAKDKDEATVLYQAAVGGHKEIIDLLLKTEASLNVRTISGSTPLHAAVMKNQMEVVDFLIQNGAKINATDNNGRTPLHVAAASPRNKHIIELLMRNEAAVNVKDKNGVTPLHIAAYNGCIDNALLLIKNKANVNAVHIFITDDVNVRCFTPLDLAILTGHKEVVEILLTNGAIINDNNRYLSPFLTAVIYNKKEIVELLISKGANVRSVGSEALITAVVKGYRKIVEILLRNEVPVNKEFNGATLLHFAARKEIVNALISRGANVNAVGMLSLTPLHAAIRAGHDGVVETFIKNGAKINAESELGTPLHVAVANGHYNIVQILLNNKARIDVKDKDNRTALELAVEYGDLEVVKLLLLSKQVEMNTKYNGLTLLQIASQQPNLEMVKYLVDEGADINVESQFRQSSKPIHIAAREGHKDIVEYFLSKGLSVNELDIDNNTLLHYAVQNCRLKVVKYLIAKGADVNAKTNLDRTPLHLAVANKCKDIIEILLKNGAMFNAVDKMNKLPWNMTNDEHIVELLTVTGKLFKAVNRGDLNNVEKYIKAGAFVNAKDVKNVTALHYAAWKGYDRIVDILLENAANPNVIINGFTPLHYAAKFSHFKVVTLLLSKAAMYNAVSSTDKTPLDLATDEKIIHLLKLISNLFENVKSDNAGVIDDLNRINDVGTVRAVMNARNEGNRSLVVAAIHSNFTNVERLKEVSQGNISYQIGRGLNQLKQGNWKVAFNCLRNALEKRRIILGPDNPGTLDIQTHLATILTEQGKYQEALEM
ncbi:uncharacterized protein LOC113465041 [Ceratina calcarata]|uniref:Uncharacterized protein LOC113465041 n=1 Tax=Ceratina calcarata TaxID=156304 RepID=A0AAJ7S9S3_9HYME|nr:uncharacterized protein LOC113465041 [Ceratina calcarata]